MEEASQTGREESDYAETSDATDEIGLSDTEESEYGENQAFQMDSILARGHIWADEDGEYAMRDRYLVKWTGYSIYKATWEPEHHFDDVGEVLFHWQNRSMRQVRGAERAFDLNRWDDEKDAVQAKRVRRHQRRNKKRDRLGLPIKAYDGDAQGADDEDEGEDFRLTQSATSESESDDNVPLASGRRKRTISLSTSDGGQGMGSSPKRRRIDTSTSKPARLLKKIGTAVPVLKTASSSARPPMTPVIPGPAAAPRGVVAEVVVKLRNGTSNKPWHKSTTGATTAVGGGATRAGRPPAINGMTRSKTVNGSGPARHVMSSKPRTRPIQNVVSGNVFSHSSRPPLVKRTRAIGENEKFRSASHRYNAQRKDASEKAPPSYMALMEPSTGARILPLRAADPLAVRGAAMSTPVARSPTSNVGTSFESSLFHSLGAHNSVSGQNHAHIKAADNTKASGNATSNGQKRTVSFDVNTSYPSEPKHKQSQSLVSERTTPTVDAQELLTQPALDDPNTFHPLTCWFWRHDPSGCRDPSACELFHAWTGKIADHNTSNTDITCLHWHTRKCCNKFEGCLYAHRSTDYVVGPNSVVRRLGQRQPRRGPWNDDDIRSKLPLRKDGKLILQKEDQTCMYWYDNNACRKPAEQCDFAHEMRAFIARQFGGPESSAGKRIRLNTGELTDEVMPVTAAIDAEQDMMSESKNATDVQQNMSRRPSRTPSPPPPVAPVRDQQLPGFVLPFSLPLQDVASLPTTQSNGLPECSRNAISTPCHIRMADDTQSFSFGASIEDLDFAMLKLLRRIRGAGSTLEIRHSFAFDTFKRFIAREDLSLLGSGDLLAIETQVLSLDRLIANLRVTSTALVHFASEYTLLLYPSDQNKFEKQFGWPASQHRGCGLHVKILKPLNTPIEAVHKVVGKQAYPASDDIKQMYVNVDELFNWHTGSALQSRVLLVFPSDRHALLESLTRNMQALGASVYQATKDGALSYFWKQIKEKDDGGAVIIDSTLTQYLHRISHLRDLTYKKVNFFRCSQGAPPELTPLLQNGVAVFLLDGCFQDRAKTTSRVVDALVNRLKHQKATRILGRPDLLTWVEKLADTTHAAEAEDAFIGGQEDTVSTYLFRIHRKLSENTDMERLLFGHAEKPSATSSVYYLPSDDWPSYAEKEADGRNANALDNEAVEWFSYWAMEHTHESRRFSVLSTASDTQVARWSNQYRHLKFFNPQEFVDHPANR